MNKPTVGQTLYSLNIGNAARNAKQKLTPVIVLKVGSKYFTTCEEEYKENNWMHTQFHLDTWAEKSDYTASAKLYKSPQDFKDEEEKNILISNIYHYFHYKQPEGCDLNNLRKIKELIEGNYLK